MLACASLCHRNVVRMPLNNLPLPHNCHQRGHFSLSCQCLASGTESRDRVEAIHGFKLSLLSTRRQDCYPSPSWAVAQYPEGWEHICPFSTLGEGREVDAEFSTAKSPFLWKPLCRKGLRCFWLSHANDVFACLFSTSRPSVNHTAASQTCRPGRLLTFASLSPILSGWCLHASFCSTGVTLQWPWHSTGPHQTQLTGHPDDVSLSTSRYCWAMGLTRIQPLAVTELQNTWKEKGYASLFWA